MHILQKVKKRWCVFFLLRIYADIFVSEFCLVVTKQHPTVIVTKCIHGIQNTSDSIVQERKEKDRNSETSAIYLNIRCNVLSVCCCFVCVISATLSPC